MGVSQPPVVAIQLLLSRCWGGRWDGVVTESWVGFHTVKKELNGPGAMSVPGVTTVRLRLRDGTQTDLPLRPWARNGQVPPPPLS